MTDIEKLIKLLEHAESFSLEAYGKSPNLSECSLNIQYLRACILQAIGNAKALRERLAKPDPLQRLTDVQQEIEAALAPEQEPVVVIKRNESGQITMQNPNGNHFDMFKYIGAKLYTAPQKREWQGLTDDEISAISKSIPGETDLGVAKRVFAREIEAKLKEKNT